MKRQDRKENEQGAAVVAWAKVYMSAYIVFVHVCMFATG